MDTLKPPPGFVSWLEYAIATMETRSLHLRSLDDEGDVHDLWHRSVQREEMRDAAKAELRDLLEACRELIGSGVELDDARIGYVVVQIDRATLEFAREAIAKAEGRKP